MLTLRLNPISQSALSRLIVMEKIDFTPSNLVSSDSSWLLVREMLTLVDREPSFEGHYWSGQIMPCNLWQQALRCVRIQPVALIC